MGPFYVNWYKLLMSLLKFVLTLSIALLFSFSIFANQNDLDLVERKFIDFYKNKNFDGANKISEDYLELSNKYLQSNQNDLGIVYYNVGSLKLELSEYFLAEKYFKKSINIFAEILNTSLKNLEQIEKLEKILNDWDTYTAMDYYGLANNNLALLYEKIGELDNALIHYDEFYRSISNLHEDRTHYSFFVYYNNTGNIYMHQGRYEEAEINLNESLYIAEQIYEDNNIKIWSVLNSIGLNFLNQRKEYEAAKIFERAWEIVEYNEVQYPDYDFRYYWAKTFHNIAAQWQIHAEKAQDYNLPKEKIDEFYMLAFHHGNESLKIKEEIYGKNHISIANGYQNLSHYHLMLFNPDEAIKYANKALEIYKLNYGTTNHINISSVYSNLGQAYANGYQDYDKSISYHVKALNIGFNTLPSDHNELLTLYGNLASAYESKESYKNQLAILNEGYSVFKERLKRTHINSEKNLNNEMNLGYDFVTEYIHSITRYLYKNQNVLLKDEIMRLSNEAFMAHQLANDSKAARAIALSSSRFKLSNENKKYLKIIQDNERNITNLEEQLSNALLDNLDNRDLNNLKNIKNDITNLKIDNDIYIEMIREKNPQFSNFSNPVALNTDDVMDKINPNQMIVSYHLGKDRITVFVIMNDEFYFFDNPISLLDLEDMITDYRENFGIYTDLDSFDYDMAHNLFKILFPFPEEFFLNVEELTIIPSGPLLSLPFATLITNNYNNTLQNASWLIKKFPISYLPSINSINFFKNNNGKNKKYNSFIGFGDPILANYSQDNSTRGAFYDIMLAEKFDSLPETRIELEEIANNLNIDPSKSLFLGEAASESIVKVLDLSNTDIIMFATHGVISGELANLYEPGLILTPPEQVSENDDGILTASEIMNLSLNAEWVLLSACNTASGEDTNSDGLSGLAKSFFYAGAKSLLVSQWYVESNATVELTTGIFRAMSNDITLNKSAALRVSIIELINSEEYAHPLYWAPFILVGQN